MYEVVVPTCDISDVCLQHVYVAKPLSRHFNVTTESGNIFVDNLYADQSSFVTRNGNVSVLNAHRDVAINIHQDGNVEIGKVTQYIYFFHYVYVCILLVNVETVSLKSLSFSM